MTREQLEGIRGKRAQIDAQRDRVKATVASEARQLEIEHQVQLTAELLALEEAANVPGPHPKAGEIAKLSPALAAARAKELRARPEYFDSGARDKDGNQLATREQRAALLAEHTELMKRAGEAQ